MESYLSLLRHVLEHGQQRDDRTGVGTIGVFGYQWRHCLAASFPLLTTKAIHTKSVIAELIWFLQGRTNNNWLRERGVRIWNEWADESGDLGPIYGAQWRNFSSPLESGHGVDQIKQLLRDLRSNPNSRRHIVTAWNPLALARMKLPPCHILWQCYVSNEGRLSIHLYARSIDSFLGLPFNIASYSLLCHVLAHLSGLKVGDLVISFGDLHIYSNHVKQVAVQLARKPALERPQFRFKRDILADAGNNPLEAIETLRLEDFEIYNYNPAPAIPAPVAV